ncbi:MAG: single-strand DNA-binding protein [Neolewinella sp.]|jgi:single-strand DNA-binding protein
MNVRNHIHLTGNLGADPKTVTLKSGTTATEFSLATNEYYRDADGKRQTKTEWHKVKAYGKVAELFDQYLQRGSQVSIVGSMKYRKWVDQFEQNRITAEVITEEFTFLSNGKYEPKQEGDTTNDSTNEATDKKTITRRAKKPTKKQMATIA